MANLANEHTKTISNKFISHTSPEAQIFCFPLTFTDKNIHTYEGIKLTLKEKVNRMFLLAILHASCVNNNNLYIKTSTCMIVREDFTCMYDIVI